MHKGIVHQGKSHSSLDLSFHHSQFESGTKDSYMLQKKQKLIIEQELKDAIECEDFEMAARLRDQLLEVTSGNPAEKIDRRTVT